MPDTDVLYADVKFTKSGRKAADASSPSHDTTYSQVNIVKTLPTPDHSGSQYQTNGKSKVTPERVALVVLSVLLIATLSAFIFLYLNSTEKKEQQNTTDLNCTEKKEQQNTTEKLSPACPKRWEQYGDKCYYFSTFNSSWDISRMFCREFGADLVKIDSEEEQRFLLNQVRVLMNRGHPEDKFWIGLTDSKKEGTWLWVDGSPLDDSLQFWWKDDTHNEPDNWTSGDPDGEDCARMGEKGQKDVTDLHRWLDKTCKMDQRSICAKPAKGRQ